MSGERSPYSVSIQIRYADIDALWHVNNARYFSYMEQARANYFQELGMWDGERMQDLGVILAQTSCEFERPIHFGDSLLIETHTIRLGDKSFDMRYEMKDSEGDRFALGLATLVCYDYQEKAAIEIPATWRQILVADPAVG